MKSVRLEMGLEVLSEDIQIKYGRLHICLFALPLEISLNCEQKYFLNGKTHRPNNIEETEKHMRDNNNFVRNGEQIRGVHNDLKPEQQVPPEKVPMKRKPTQITGLPKSQNGSYQVLRRQGGSRKGWLKA